MDARIERLATPGLEARLLLRGPNITISWAISRGNDSKENQRRMSENKTKNVKKKNIQQTSKGGDRSMATSGWDWGGKGDRQEIDRYNSS